MLPLGDVKILLYYGVSTVGKTMAATAEPCCGFCLFQKKLD